MDWVLRERSMKATNLVTDVVHDHFKRLTDQGIVRYLVCAN